jgi:hypothetical protein
VGFDIVYVMPPATNADIAEVAIIDRTDNPVFHKNDAF